MFIDSHAHLFFKDFKDDLDDVIKRAQEAGVDYIVNPGTDLETSRQSIELAERFEMVYACVGFHPHDASKADGKSLEEIEQLSLHPKVVGIGEIGLDYHYNFSPPEKQREVFSQQIEIALRRNLPIVIHSREAEDDTLRIVEEYAHQSRSAGSPPEQSPGVQPASRGPLRGVFHCFPGDAAMAQKVIGWGFYISIPGFVTFGSKPTRPNSMVEVASKIPARHILLETDSPYLTPAPNRGKRNEPANIPFIAEKIAQLQGLTAAEIGRASSAGVRELFGIGK